MAYLSFKLSDECKESLLSMTVARFRHIKCDHVTIALDWLPYDVYAVAAAEMRKKYLDEKIILFVNPFQTKFDHQAEVMLATIFYAPPDDFQNTGKWYQRSVSPDRVYHLTYSLNDGCAPKLGKEVAKLWPQTMDVPDTARESTVSLRQYANENGWAELSGTFISAT